MNKYNFSMEKILDLRVNKEKDVMVKFATLQNELHQQKLVLSKLENQMDTLNKEGYKSLDVHKLRFNNLYKQNLENQIDVQNERIEWTSNELEDMRLDLVSAQKDRKIMEKLKEKDFTLYKNNLKVLEQKELDEIAIQRHKKI